VKISCTDFSWVYILLLICSHVAVHYIAMKASFHLLCRSLNVTSIWDRYGRQCAETECIRHGQEDGGVERDGKQAMSVLFALSPSQSFSICLS
jgi:hypothetical protein